MDWDNLPENLEARYLRGLKVESDQALKGFGQALLYGAGAITIWAWMPYAVFLGWVKVGIWSASFLFLYWSLRGLAVMEASFRWSKAHGKL